MKPKNLTEAADIIATLMETANISAQDATDTLVRAGDLPPRYMSVKQVKHFEPIEPENSTAEIRAAFGAIGYKKLKEMADYKLKKGLAAILSSRGSKENV